MAAMQPAGGGTMDSTKKRGFGLSTKIIATAVGVLIAVVAVNYAVFMTGYSRDTQAGLIEKASSFTAVADESKNHGSKLIALGAIKSEELLAEAVAHVEKGGSYTDTKFFETIPVVVGWTAAEKAAAREGLTFKIASFEARNPENEPTPGSFREQMLRELTASVESGGEKAMGRIDDETNTLHYMRAITLDQSCMSCHGDPKIYDEDGDGKDALGFAMENWPVGYMHGAYEVQLPLDTMDAQIAGFFRNGMLITVPLVLVALGGFAWLLRVMLARPLNSLIDVVQDIATGDGDLTKRLNITRSDEIGKLAHWFDAFLDNLHGIISDVSGATRQVAAASTEIAASSEQMAVGLSRQEEQTTQVSAAVQEMSASVQEVAQKSIDASNSARESGARAGEGGSVVQETILEINGISQQVADASAAIAELGKRGEQIGAIIEVINDIADQTNLLALNAAIEAARAGEHGRGFAVVADEVRKLAERTTQATDEVAQSIRAIQQDTSTAVDRIEASATRVGRGVELATGAGDALEQIVSSSGGLLGQVEGIASAAEEQSAVSEQIAHSVEQINAVTRESNEGAAQASEAAANLSEQAERLQSLVGRFKTE